MDASRNSIARLLAGLQVGILGGLATLTWFMILSQIHFRAPWTLLNLFAAHFRGGSYWGYSFSWSTLVGAALHLFACGCFGVFIGWVLPKPPAGTRFSLAGAAFGAILSLMVYEFFWRRQVPRLGTFTTPGSIFLIHLLIGACFALFPRYYLKIAPSEGAEAEVQLR